MNRTQIPFSETGGLTIERVVELNSETLCVVLSGNMFALIEAEAGYDGDVSLNFEHDVEFSRGMYREDSLEKVFDKATIDAWKAEDDAGRKAGYERRMRYLREEYERIGKLLGEEGK